MYDGFIMAKVGKPNVKKDFDTSKNRAVKSFRVHSDLC
jgi:hypothetical protein